MENDQRDSWKKRFRLIDYAYALNVITMLTIQEVAKREFKKLEPAEKTMVLKLVRNFHWKQTKDNAASVIEEICQILDPKKEIALLNGVLDSCCQIYSFYNDFGLNHIFAVIFSPLLVNSSNWQEKYFVRIALSPRRVSLSEILNLHNKILLWHELYGQCQVNPIFGLDEEFIRKATIESREFELDSDPDNKFENCNALSRAIEVYYEEKNLGFNGRKGGKL